MTLMVLPFVAQAAKQGHRTEFIAQRSRGLPIRTPVPREVRTALEALKAAEKAEAAAAREAMEALEAVEGVDAEAAKEAPTSTSASPSPSTSMSTPPTVPDAASLRSPAASDLVKAEEQQQLAVESVVLTHLDLARAFNDAEEDRLYGPAVLDDDGHEVEPASPMLGVYALAIATALVGGCTALGVWGTAKYLGVSNVSGGRRAEAPVTHTCAVFLFLGLMASLVSEPRLTFFSSRWTSSLHACAQMSKNPCRRSSRMCGGRATSRRSWCPTCWTATTLTLTTTSCARGSRAGDMGMRRSRRCSQRLGPCDVGGRGGGRRSRSTES